MSLDETTLARLIEMRDDAGVLSFYAGITPEGQANPQPAWRIEIKNRIRDLRQKVRDEEEHERWKAVHDRLDALEPELDQFLDPSRSGRGRAMFVAVSDGHRETVTVQVPFAERVLWRENAYIRPLVAAWDEGRPAGILVVHRGGTRLLEWQMGEARELDTNNFGFGDAQLADRKSGPAPPNPQRAQQSVNNRERFEDRLDENRKRFLRSALEDHLKAGKEHGWDRLVVAGENKLRQWVVDQINGGNDLRVVEADQLWETDAPHTIATSVWPTLRSMHRERELDLVGQARDRALSGNAGALGLRDVLGALNEGRVAHLLFSTEVNFTGFRSADQGLLFAEEGGPAEALGEELIEEPYLVERMLERALSTSGKVTPVDDEVAALLDENDGVAALLRW